MTPVLPTSSICYFSSLGNASITKKDCYRGNCGTLWKFRNQTVPQRYSTPLSISPLLFSPFRNDSVLLAKLRTHKVTASGTDVAVEEANPAVNHKESDDSVGSLSVPAEESEDSSIKSNAISISSRSKPPRVARKSDMPPIKNEDLVPGATFTGKVRSILQFGAFVDFGAFTDGLVHVSQLSDSFVKDVKDVVSIGQEVTVRLVEANTETGRISLTMRNSDETNKGEPQKQVNSGSDNSRSPRKSNLQSNQRRNETRKSSKFVKGQELEGTVKNLTRSGAFISLPEGEEGFLPTSEEAAEGFGNMMGGTSLQAGQEVKVRVLRFNRGQVTLTMKDEDDGTGSDTLIRPSVVHTATNPFVLAFRQNKDISAFLDKHQKEMEQTSETVVLVNNAVDKIGSPETIDNHKGQEAILPEASSMILTLEAGPSVLDDQTEVSPFTDKAENVEEPDLSQQVTNFSSETVISEEITQTLIPDVAVEDITLSQKLVEHNSPVKSEEVEPDQEINSTVASEQVEVASNAESMINEGELVEAFENQIDGATGDDETQVESLREESKHTSAVVECQTDIATVADDTQAEGLIEESRHASPIATVLEQSESNDKDSSSVEKDGASLTNETTTKGSISAALVKQLREESGAGMMDCKKALTENGGDIIKAQEYLRKKGLASADKKASRTTAEGRVGAYIHDSRIGVLIEVNCETDFVARGDIFKELVDDLAMQVAACSQVQYIDTNEIPIEIVDKEREIESQKEDLLNKPEQIRSKIVDGRIRKRLEDLALLEQPFIKNDKTLVKDLVKQTIATIGENIKVKRFARYNLGEGLEKKSQDFAAEVAAQTAAKAPALGKHQFSMGDAKETVEKSSKATISAVLVKQLREETGAGMMDCKKALSETGGDLEKAQDYLRKKGLSAADKKSSRLAAEGRIGSYIHDSRIGVLIEVNCETDFVGRSEKFKELVDDLAMQIAACPQVEYVSLEDIPAEIVNKEKELEMQREDLQSKPENIREKIVEGRVSKRLGELVLLEQAFIKEDSVLVKDIVKQSVAAIGENIKVRRFVRFTLGDRNKGGE